MSITVTKHLLEQYYNLTSESENLPRHREKSKWQSENNFGFLIGIISFGLHIHQNQLFNLLQSNQFKEQEQSFIDSMFDYYVRPFHKSYNTESETPSTASSKTTSSIEDDFNYVPEEKELLHKDFKKAVVRRDGVCLFCWNKLECEGAHIIAQKNIPIAYDDSSLLQRAGLAQKHQVQNGLLLCQICHSQFDKLKRFLDVDDNDKLVVKVVNETNDQTSDKHREWVRTIRDLKGMRILREEDWAHSDQRKAVESNGKMALYFTQNHPDNLPNRNALEFHKTACLIWRMAGGAENDDDEYCSDDEQGPINTAALKKRFKLKGQDSSSALNPDTDSIIYI